MNSQRMKRSEKQGREGKVHPIKCRVSKNSCKRQEGLLQLVVFNKRVEISSGKLETSRELSAQRWHNKGLKMRET